MADNVSRRSSPSQKASIDSMHIRRNLRDQGVLKKRTNLRCIAEASLTSVHVLTLIPWPMPFDLVMQSKHLQKLLSQLTAFSMLALSDCL